jgi:hypothetical protein
LIVLLHRPGGKGLREAAGWSGALMTLRVLLREPGAPIAANPVLAELDAEIDRVRGDD